MSVLERARQTFADRFYDGWSFVLVLFAVALPAVALLSIGMPPRQVAADGIQLAQPAYQFVAGFGMLGALGLVLSAARDDARLPRTAAEFVADFLAHWAFLAVHIAPAVALVTLGFGALFGTSLLPALPTVLLALLLGTLALGIWCAVMQTVAAIGTTFRGRIVGAVFTALLVAQFGASLGSITFGQLFAAPPGALPFEPGRQLLLVLSVLSPGGAVGGLVEMLVDPIHFYGERYAEAFPMLYRPWFYALATLLWFAVPLALGAWRAQTRPPVDPDDPTEAGDDSPDPDRPFPPPVEAAEGNEEVST